MVSVVIGMLALMFATRLITGSEQSKQSALGGSDSMQNGMLAMFSISSDAGQAGWGLNDPLLARLQHQLHRQQSATRWPRPRAAAPPSRPLAPAMIESNGSAIRTSSALYSGSVAGRHRHHAPGRRLRAAATRIDVDREPYGFALGDVIVVAPEDRGGDCALAQISADRHRRRRQIQSCMVGGGANCASTRGDARRRLHGQPARACSTSARPPRCRSTPGRSTTASCACARPTWPAPARRRRRWPTTSSRSRRSTASIPAPPPPSPRAAACSVGSWSATMIDADGDGVTGGAGDYQRIAARAHRRGGAQQDARASERRPAPAAPRRPRRACSPPRSRPA